MNRLINLDDFLKLQNEEKNLVILDCRFDLMNKTYGIDSYNEGHIKGALLVDIEHDLTREVTQHGGRHPFASYEKLQKVMSGYGVCDDSVVVAYDDGDLQGAARLVFQLNNLGFKNAYVLDGGLTAYKKNGGLIEVEKNDPILKSTPLTVNVDDSFIVDMEYVKDRLYDDNVMLLDSRSNPRYLGLTEPVDKKAGHIPSAYSYFFMDVLDLENIDKTSFKSDDFLKEYFKEVDPNKEIIVYCGSGISLMVNALALDKVGIEYKIYPGSFSDWISYDDNKIATSER